MKSIDVAVIIAYFLLMAGMGFWFMRRNRDADAYFKAGGKLPWWVVSLSIYATMFSSITFISIPAMSFSGDMSYFAISFGILLMAACFLAGALLPGMHAVMYLLFALVGLGWAAINVNSFPMVVEMASGADIGKYTGYYYTFSMAAQVLTPILSGALLEHVGYHTLFPYAMAMLLCAFVTFFFVKKK